MGRDSEVSFTNRSELRKSAVRTHGPQRPGSSSMLRGGRGDGHTSKHRRARGGEATSGETHAINTGTHLEVDEENGWFPLHPTEELSSARQALGRALVSPRINRTLAHRRERISIDSSSTFWTTKSCCMNHSRRLVWTTTCCVATSSAVQSGQQPVDPCDHAGAPLNFVRESERELLGEVAHL